MLDQSVQKLRRVWVGRPLRDDLEATALYQRRVVGSMVDQKVQLWYELQVLPMGKPRRLTCLMPSCDCSIFALLQCHWLNRARILKGEQRMIWEQRRTYLNAYRPASSMTQSPSPFLDRSLQS